MKYEQLTDGKTVRPNMRRYRLQCCDCGLVHDVSFKIIPAGNRNHVEFTVRRNNRATAAVRRKKKP